MLLPLCLASGPTPACRARLQLKGGKPQARGGGASPRTSRLRATQPDLEGLDDELKDRRHELRKGLLLVTMGEFPDEYAEDAYAAWVRPGIQGIPVGPAIAIHRGNGRAVPIQAMLRDRRDGASSRYLRRRPRRRRSFKPFVYARLDLIIRHTPL